MTHLNSPSRISFSHVGVPSAVASIAPISPPEPLTGSQVALQLVASPINPSDGGTLMGVYGRMPDLPAVPGQSAYNLIKGLAKSGTLITIGAKVKEPIRFPTRYLIFKDISLKGFWLDEWLSSHEDSEIHSMFHSVFTLINKNIITIPIDHTYDLSQISDALSHAAKAHRNGKILLTSSYIPK